MALCSGEHGRVWASDSEPDESAKIEADDFVHTEKDFISLMSCTPGKVLFGMKSSLKLSHEPYGSI